MVERQFPKVRDLAPLMQFKRPELNAKKRRLAGALTIYDLRAIAQRRTPKAAFDYTEGAAEAEISLARARQAFEDIQFTPRSCVTCPTSTPAAPCSVVRLPIPSVSPQPGSPE